MTPIGGNVCSPSAMKRQQFDTELNVFYDLWFASLTSHADFGYDNKLRQFQLILHLQHALSQRSEGILILTERK